MDDDAQRVSEAIAKDLQDNYGVHALPYRIDYNAYVNLMHFLTNCDGESVTLYCAGAGGLTDYAFAMVDLIKRHGDVTGYLVGTAYSCHSLIFSACQHRYVTPHSAIATHQPSFEVTGGTADVIHRAAFRLGRIERQIVDLYVSASNQDAEWWGAFMKNDLEGDFRFLEASNMIAIEMAQELK